MHKFNARGHPILSLALTICIFAHNIIPIKVNADSINNGLVGYFSFDTIGEYSNTYEIRNTVNNKVYNNGNTTLISGFAQKGRLFNNNKIEIPTEDLNINYNTKYVTMSFMYRVYDDEIRHQVPIGFNSYGLYLGENVAISTGYDEDAYGTNKKINNNDGYVNITVIFAYGEVEQSEIYINGVKQSCSRLNDIYPDNFYAYWGDTLVIGGRGMDNNFNMKNTVIDELRIWNKKLNESEVSKLYHDYYEMPVPDVTYQNTDKGVSLQWSVDIAPKDITYKTGYERNDPKPDLTGDSVNGDINGGQRIDQTSSMLGKNSLVVNNTYKYGNHRDAYKATEFHNSVARYDNVTIPSGAKIAVSYFTKTNTDTVVDSFNGNSVDDDYNEQWDNILQTALDGGWIPDVYTHSYIYYVDGKTYGYPNANKKGSTNIVVCAPKDLLMIDGPTGRSYFTEDENGILKTRFKYTKIQSIDSKNNIYLCTIQEALEKNHVDKELLKFHYYVSFGFKKIGVTKPEGIKRVYLTTDVPYFKYFDPLEEGLTFRGLSWTHGTMHIDELTLGYASEVQLFRNGVQIYRGYDESYVDNDAKDTTPPIAPSLSKGVGSYNSIIFTAYSYDVGTYYKYNLQAKGRNYPNWSQLTKDISIYKTSGFKGYYYRIVDFTENMPNVVSLNYSDSFSDKGNFVIKNVTSGKKRVYVAGVDNMNNISSSSYIDVEVKEPNLDIAATPQIKGTDNYCKLNINMGDVSKKYKYDIYRDGNYISTIDYNNSSTNVFNDYGAKDTIPPNPVKNIKTLINSNMMNISYDESEDQGNYYMFNVKGIGENSISINSNTSTVNITKGLAGYSYIIDAKPLTIPNGNINTTSNSIAVPVKNLSVGTNYLHILSVDKAGNKSQTTHSTIIIKPDMQVSLQGKNINLGMITINRPDNLYVEVSTNGTRATVKFPFRVTNKGKTYPANTEINLEYDKNSNNYKDSFKIADYISTELYNISFCSYSADNTTKTTTTGKLYVKSLSIDGLRALLVINSSQNIVLPVDCPLYIPLNIKTGYDIALEVKSQGQNEVYLDMFSNGNEITVFSNDKISNNKVKKISSNSINSFVFYLDDLPEGRIVDVKITICDNNDNYIVDDILGKAIFKIIGSYKKDVIINNTH